MGSRLLSRDALGRRPWWLIALIVTLLVLFLLGVGAAGGWRPDGPRGREGLLGALALWSWWMGFYTASWWPPRLAPRARSGVAVLSMGPLRRAALAANALPIFLLLRALSEPVPVFVAGFAALAAAGLAWFGLGFQFTVDSKEIARSGGFGRHARLAWREVVGTFAYDGGVLISTSTGAQMVITWHLIDGGPYLANVMLEALPAGTLGLAASRERLERVAALGAPARG